MSLTTKVLMVVAVFALIVVIAAGFALGLGNNNNTNPNNQLTNASLASIIPNVTYPGHWGGWTVTSDEQNFTAIVSLGFPAADIYVTNAVMQTFNVSLAYGPPIGTFDYNVTIYLFNYPNATTAASVLTALEDLVKAEGGYTVVDAGTTNPSTPFVYLTENSTAGSMEYTFGSMRNTAYVITETGSSY